MQPGGSQQQRDQRDGNLPRVKAGEQEHTTREFRRRHKVRQTGG
jgi:hypothetical protein